MIHKFTNTVHSSFPLPRRPILLADICRQYDIRTSGLAYTVKRYITWFCRGIKSTEEQNGNADKTLVRTLKQHGNQIPFIALLHLQVSFHESVFENLTHQLYHASLHSVSFGQLLKDMCPILDTNLTMVFAQFPREASGTTLTAS